MYYLIQNKIISKTCSDEPEWLKKFEYWKIVTSPDMKESIIISEKEIPIIPTDRMDIRKLTEDQSQDLETKWHPTYEVEREGRDKKIVTPISIKSFGNNWNKLKNRIDKIKEKKNG